MAARHRQTRTVERSRADLYLRKSTEFLETMREALVAERWSAAGLNAVHCAISASDAVLVYYAGHRPAGPDHDSAADLLATLNKVPDAAAKAQSLRRILDRKNLIEYEDRICTAQEAADTAKLAERLHLWAKDKVQA